MSPCPVPAAIPSVRSWISSSSSSSIRSAASAPAGLSVTSFQSFSRPIIPKRAQSSCGVYRVAIGRRSARLQPSHAQAMRRTAITGCAPVCSSGSAR
eukprot:7390426-Prymnesium_polylepis.1